MGWLEDFIGESIEKLAKRLDQGDSEKFDRHLQEQRAKAARAQHQLEEKRAKAVREQHQLEVKRAKAISEQQRLAQTEQQKLDTELSLKLKQNGFLNDGNWSVESASHLLNKFGATRSMFKPSQAWHKDFASRLEMEKEEKYLDTFITNLQHNLKVIKELRAWIINDSKSWLLSEAKRGRSFPFVFPSTQLPSIEFNHYFYSLNLNKYFSFNIENDKSQQHELINEFISSLLTIEPVEKTIKLYATDGITLSFTEQNSFSIKELIIFEKIVVGGR